MDEQKEPGVITDFLWWLYSPMYLGVSRDDTEKYLLFVALSLVPSFHVFSFTHSLIELQKAVDVITKDIG